MLDSASGTDLSGCSCPPRCTNNVHQTTVSSSRLSDMMIKYYVRHGKNDSQIGRSYVNAAEIRNRVASSSLTDIVGHLETTRKTYQRLEAMLAVDLIEHTTSVPGQIHASVSTIVQKTLHSLAEFSSQVVGKFADHYEQNVDFLVTQLIKSAKSILTSPYHLYLSSIDASDADHFVVRRAEKLFEHRDTLCQTLHILGESVYEVNPGVNFSAQLFLDRSCLSELHAINCGPSELEALTPNNTEYVEKMVELIFTMGTAAKAVLRCIPVYRTFLTEVDVWMKRALAMNSSQSLQSADRRHVLKELEHDLQWLEEISLMFAQKSMVRSFLYSLYNRIITSRPKKSCASGCSLAKK